MEHHFTLPHAGFCSCPGVSLAVSSADRVALMALSGAPVLFPTWSYSVAGAGTSNPLEGDSAPECGLGLVFHVPLDINQAGGCLVLSSAASLLCSAGSQLPSCELWRGPHGKELLSLAVTREGMQLPAVPGPNSGAATAQLTHKDCSPRQSLCWRSSVSPPGLLTHTTEW